MFRVAILAGLFIVNVVIFWHATPRPLSVHFLDVGQGDAIFIESPTGAQILIDGGADGSVLRELGETMSFFDRAIDAVMATHPDLDHVGGLPGVLERYEVGIFLESGVEHETSATAALDRALQRESVPRVLARAPMRLVLGGGVYADILYPDRDVSKVESNAGSIVMRLVYGAHEFMLTGDAPSSVEHRLVFAHRDTLSSDVLKAGHHGSKTSSSQWFIDAVRPQFVIFSRGCENRYGHPAKEVVARFEEGGVTAIDTCTSGTISFTSNGEALSFQEKK